MGALNHFLAANPILANPLTIAWAAWLTAGVALAVWYYQARKEYKGFTVVQAAPKSATMIPKSGVRPAVKAAPPPKQDAFEELQTLLDGPGDASQPSDSAGF